jgi:eukaryotic-like serine/threonine-protein kinase
MSPAAPVSPAQPADAAASTGTPITTASPSAKPAAVAPPSWPVTTGPLPAWPVSRAVTEAGKPKPGVVPAQRTPSDDEVDAGTSAREDLPPTEPSDLATDPDEAGVGTATAADPDDGPDPDDHASPPSTTRDRPAADRASTLIAPTTGPADAITPARPHSVRAIAQVVALPGLGADAASRRRRVLAVVIGLIVVLAGVVWVVSRDEDTDGFRNGQSGDASPQATATQQVPSAAPSDGGSTGDPAEPTGTPPVGGDATTAPGGPRPALPDGWREYTDSTGFSLYVPANWRVSREGRMVYFRGDGRVLGIDQTDQPRPDPVADWRGQAAVRVANGDFPNYDEIRIDAVPFWQKAADWEFTYGSSGRRTHVNNRGFVVSSHKAYGIWWQAPDADWADASADLQLIFASFRPAPAALD